MISHQVKTKRKPDIFTRYLPQSLENDVGVRKGNNAVDKEQKLLVTFLRKIL